MKFEQLVLDLVLDEHQHIPSQDVRTGQPDPENPQVYMQSTSKLCWACNAKVAESDIGLCNFCYPTICVPDVKGEDLR